MYEIPFVRQITMKPTHVLAIILATGFGIFWCFMIWSAGQWPKTTLQGEGNGNFYEQKRRRADAEAFAREAFNDTPPPLQREALNNTPPSIQSEDFMPEEANKSPVPVNDATSVSEASWGDRLAKKIDHWVRVLTPSWMPGYKEPSPPQITGYREDFKTINGKQYKDTKVTCVEPDGIVVKYKLGISKLFFVELPKEVQERFHYNPRQAAAYSAAQAATYEVYQKQQEEIRRQQEEAYARNYVAYLQQEAANRNAQASADQVLIQEQRNRPTSAYQSTHLNGHAVISQLPVVPPQPYSPHK